MPRQVLRILALNPGTRFLGIAFFQGVELRDWRIKIFKEGWSEKKENRILDVLSGVMGQWSPKALAIKKLNPSRASASLKRLVAKMKRLAKREKLKVWECSLPEIERFFAPDERINKKELAERVALAYPELFSELQREKAHKNPYYLKMFEAVALGSVCLQQLEKNHGKQ